MPVAIKVDQTAAPIGVAGRAREDLATGTAVQLTAVGGPYLAYQWRIIHKPINILTPVRSAALLATPTSAVTLLSPINVAGTHLIEVAVDSGQGLGAGVADIARITFYAGPTLATDPRQLPRRKIAAFEGLEHNVPDTLDPTGNPDGWSRERYRWDAVVEALVPGKSFANGRITNPSGVPAIVRANGIGTPVHIAPGITRVPFLTAAPDTLYAVHVSGAATGTSPSSYVSVQYQNLLTTSFDVLTYDLSTPGPSDDYDFCFRIELEV